MSRISVDLPGELEKQLRVKTVERFGGKKGDLSRAVERSSKNVDSQKRIDHTEVPFPVGTNGDNNTKEGCFDPKIVQATVDSSIFRILIIN